MRSIAWALLVLAGTGQAQVIHRCGNAFSPHPCHLQQPGGNDTRPAIRDNETVRDFAERQARYAEERAARAPRPAVTLAGTDRPLR